MIPPHQQAVWNSLSQRPNSNVMSIGNQPVQLPKRIPSQVYMTNMC